ncbi:MAG: type II toxin-antitoxin system HicA family toxin [Nanoarchaeota archaeon]|nr:type II toxin-antitoxin system HicA family toxin [Nanoarchaeota archaeon]
MLRQNKYPFRRLTIPKHKSLAKGTLRAIIKQSGLTKEEFLKFLT